MGMGAAFSNWWGPPGWLACALFLALTLVPVGIAAWFMEVAWFVTEGKR